MPRRSWLLPVLLFLLVQTGALLHVYLHGLHPHEGDYDAPACEQCLAFATLGAALPGALPLWLPPQPSFSCDAPAPAASPCGFRPTYQSRAPPRFSV